ncbi:MAG TPA: AAA family ATPase [Microlunatus sp.]
MDPAPFVGRQQELRQLRALVASGRTASRPVVAVVNGEMGIGKTHLVGEFCAEQFGGARRLRITGHEMERVVPFAAATELLAGLAAVPGEGPRLTALMERTGPRAGDWLGVLEAARRCLIRSPPALLIVDDLQWVDELSLALLHYLLRAAAELPLTVLVATRPSSTAMTLAEALGRLVQAPDRFIEITLGPLECADGVRLVMALSPGITETAAGRVWQRCGGIPFWMATAVRQDLSGDAAIAASWLGDLSADSLELLAVLAVQPGSVADDSVRSTLGWTDLALRTAGDVLIRRGIARRLGSSIGVTHDAVRDAVTSVLPGPLPREAHRRVATDLDRPATDDLQVLRRVVAHRLAAGESAAQPALRILRAANHRLLGRTDIQEFAGIADTETAEGRSWMARELRVAVARVASELGHPELAVEQWSSIMVSAPNPAERSGAALSASMAALDAGDRPRAFALLAECRPAVLDCPATEIRYAAHESELHGDSTEASERPMRRAVLLADRIVRADSGITELPAGLSAAYLAAHRAAYYFELRGDRPAGMLTQADLMARAATTVEDRLTASLHRVPALRLLARYAEAESACRSVRLAAVREQIPALAFLSGYLLALCLHSLGRLESARSAAADVAAMADRAPVVIPSWLSAAWIHALIPEIDVSVIGWSAARDAFVALCESEPNPHFRLHIRAAGAQWAARLGGADDASMAASWARDGAHDAELAGCTRCAAEHALRSAEVFARVGDAGAARRLLDEWDAGHPRPTGQSRLWRTRAEGLIEAHSDPARAVGALLAARSEAAATNAKLEHVWCELDLGSTLAEGDRERAVEVLSAAAAAAGRLQAVSEERRALALLRRLGVRTWRPHRQSPPRDDGLTQREVAIARMISDGASNPEIAEALFLSRKTVERHVSNALAKTGSRNRAELAARWAGPR